MPPALKPAAPSRRLLKFLRAQSERLAFAECAAALPAARRNVCFCSSRTRPPSQRGLGTPVTRRQTTVQAAFPGLHSVLPRSLTRQRMAASTKSHEPTPAGGAPRYASSGQTPRQNGDKLTWQEWLFGPNSKKKKTEPLKENDLGVQLEEESDTIFQRRSLTAKAALDPRLRCTEVDGNGNVIMVDGELKKSELIARVRDRRWERHQDCVTLTFAPPVSTASFRATCARSTRPTSPTSSSARRPFSSTCST